MSNILMGLAQILNIVFEVYRWIVIIAVVITWFSPDPSNPLVKALRSLTEPVFRFFRRHLPFLVAGGIDFSPMVVFLVLIFLDYALVRNLMDFAERLR